MTEQHVNTFSFSMYAPNGVRVYFVGSADTDAQAVITAALKAIAATEAAGFTARERGIEEGEQTEQITYVVRRVKTNDDGTETPLIDLYPEKLNFKFLSIYLNTPTDVQAFESACGVKLSALPVYDGEVALERGKNVQKDSKYVRMLAHNAGIVWKQNPRYEGETDKKNPKRVMVRWLNAAPTQSATPPAGNPALDTLVSESHWTTDADSWGKYIDHLMKKLGYDNAEDAAFPLDDFCQHTGIPRDTIDKQTALAVGIAYADENELKAYLDQSKDDALKAVVSVVVQKMKTFTNVKAA